MNTRKYVPNEANLKWGMAKFLHKSLKSALYTGNAYDVAGLMCEWLKTSHLLQPNTILMWVLIDLTGGLCDQIVLM